MSADRVRLTAEERALLEDERGPSARRLAMRIVCRAAELLDAPSLLPVTSAHIDGCLYHGDSGVRFAERLQREGGEVQIPTTLNVGGLDLLQRAHVRAGPHRTDMALRLMRAYQGLGCQPTWTCAPYQVGHRPALGEQVAWGESNAVAFANSVLGARTNRYGDFLDICCALVGRAPRCGLHVPENRLATVVVDVSGLSTGLRESESFYPVLGSWLGRAVGSRISAIVGLPPACAEDRLKALGAAAASTGAVALFHAVGSTPEAPDLDAALGGRQPERTLRVSASDLRDTLATMSTAVGDDVDVVALGSPHFSHRELTRFEGLLDGRPCRLPVYVCTARDTLAELEADGRAARLRDAGVTLLADTCVVVAPVLPPGGGTLLTNSGKFAHYTPGTTGYDVLFGSLSDCVETAVAGRLIRDRTAWS